jgi:hypothetical protein
MRWSALPLLLFPTVALAAPDIVFVSIVGAPQSALPGSPVTLQITLRNDGDAAAAFTTSLRASSDTTFGLTDPFMCDVAIPGLAAGQTRPFAASCTFPATLTNGTWFVVGRTAVGLADSNPANDEAVSSAVNVVGGTGGGSNPDLRPVSLTPPGSVAAGIAFTLSYDLTNEGNATAGGSTSQVWVSSDAVYNGGDLPVCSDGLPSLSPGNTLTRTVSGCVVPAAVPPGPVFLILTADSQSALTESDESDNDIAVPVVISGGVTPTPTPTPAPTGDIDLRFDSLQGPTEAAPGETLPLTLSLTNTGDQAASPTTAEIRLSTNDRFDSVDTLLCTPSVDAIGPGRTETLAPQGCAVPALAPPGNGFLVVRVDSTDVHAEADEGDN